MSPAHLVDQGSRDRLDPNRPARQARSIRLLVTRPCLVLVTLAAFAAAPCGALSTARGQEAVPAQAETSDGGVATASLQETGLRGNFASFEPSSAEQGL